MPQQFQQINRMMQMAQAARDPAAAARQMIAQNPNLQQAYQYVQQNGGDYKAAAAKLAQERGYDLNAMLQNFSL